MLVRHLGGEIKTRFRLAGKTSKPREQKTNHTHSATDMHSHTNTESFISPVAITAGQKETTVGKELHFNRLRAKIKQIFCNKQSEQSDTETRGEMEESRVGIGESERDRERERKIKEAEAQHTHTHTTTDCKFACFEVQSVFLSCVLQVAASPVGKTTATAAATSQSTHTHQHIQRLSHNYRQHHTTHTPWLELNL